MIDKFKSPLRRLLNTRVVFFIAVMVILIPFVRNISSGPVGNSINNAEQWVNLTNAIFMDGQPFIFSYGPLFWLLGGVAEYYNAVSYYISILFVLAIYTFLVWAVVCSMLKSNGYVFFFVVLISFFSFYAFKVTIFLWPLVLLFYLQLKSEKEVLLRTSACIVMAILAGFFLYIRFFYGLVSVAIIGGYLAGHFLFYFKLKEVVVFVVSFVFSSLVFGLCIYGDLKLIADYFVINMQLSFGNAVDMTLDVVNFTFVYVCSFIVLGCFIIYGLFRRKLFLIPLLATWLLLFKLGYGRADHYFSYFVIPCVFITLLISFDKGIFAKIIFLVSFCSLYYLGANSVYDNSPKRNLAFTNFSVPKISNPFILPFSRDVSYQDRMATVYRDYKITGEVLDTVSKGTVDVYPYNNEYIFANKLEYQHRPLFQNYMTLTPYLDNLNSIYFSGKERPRNIIWNSGIMCINPDCNSFNTLDNKYVLNEDPLTVLSILENYKFDKLTSGKNKEPVALFSTRDAVLPAYFTIDKKVKMKFGVWYSLPENIHGVIKVSPDLKITLLGRMKNLIFRGNVLKVKYRLTTGIEKEYRLNIINSKSGVWASPLLDGFDSEGFTGENVSEIMFVTDSAYYFEPEFESTISVSEQNLFSYRPRKVKFNEQVNSNLASTAQQIDCQGSIDSVIQSQGVGENRTPLQASGWLAQSTSDGALFDHVYLSLTNQQKQITLVETNKMNRGDLINVFGHRELENAGFISNIDASQLHGPYVLSVSGRKGDELFSCRNLQSNLNFK
jgi:hypothetical protein